MEAIRIASGAKFLGKSQARNKQLASGNMCRDCMKEKKTYLVTATGNLARSIFLGQGLDLTNVEGSFKSVSCGLLQGYIFLR